jgi:hypothetical protein
MWAVANTMTDTAEAVIVEDNDVQFGISQKRDGQASKGSRFSGILAGRRGSNC